MTTTTRTFALSLLSALSLGACTVVPQNGEQISSTSSIASSSSASSDMTSGEIQPDSPLPGALVTSPLLVTGDARGTWYFEANFPVKLLDANGNVLVQHYAEAQSDWMTTDFVPYQATLTFPVPTTATGTLILEKANPSGLPANEASVSIEVSFQ